MKPRKVIVHLELKSDLYIKDLQNIRYWEKMMNLLYFNHLHEVHQVSVQVVKEGK